MLNESVVEAAALDYFEGLDFSAVKMKHRGSTRVLEASGNRTGFSLEFD